MKLPALRKLPPAVRVLVFLASLYVFLLSIELLGAGFKGLGGGFTQTLFSLTAAPIAGLFVGILATAVCQSSSSTTSVVVGLVAAGQLDIKFAIPVVMGANIGTTVTNFLVSFGLIARRQEFERAFSTSIMHDTFNILSVALLLPLEMAFSLLERSSGWLAVRFAGIGGLSFASPLKLATRPVIEFITGLTGRVPWVALVVALVLLFAALKLMVEVMRSLISGRAELVIDRYLFGNAARAFAVGLVFTMLIQSSSATMAIAVPMAGAGILTLRQLFPYALGTNVGTTITANLAALVTGNVAAVQVAFVHLLFNCFGVAVWFPLRAIPLAITRVLGGFCARYRVFAVLFLLVVFFAVPLLVVILLRR
ncbi:MAG: Na/Pi symporter [bacterium]